MRHGICVGIKQIKYLKEAGCDYAEIALNAINQLSDDEFEVLLKENENNDVKVEITNGFFPSNIGIVWPGFNTKIISEYANHALNRASRLGVKVCVLGCGKNRTYGVDYSCENALEDFEKTISIISGIAEKYGITIAIEPLNYEETNIVNTVKEAYDVVKRMNRDNVKLIADFYHMRANNEDFSILKDVGNSLAHVHISCYTAGRKFPLSLKEDRYKEFFDVLKEIGYDKTVSIEAGVTDLLAEAKIAIPLLKSL